MKLSLCTTCMGRLHDLKQTLPHNIEMANKFSFDVEFVILNYNSQDGLAEWVQGELLDQIERGQVLHAHERTVKAFSMGHSRNLAFRIATGDFVFNMDADNFLPDGFIRRVFEEAEEHPERLALARANKMMHGLIGFWKHDFIEELGGYDESFFGYGLDDRDLIERAKALGFTYRAIKGKESKVRRIEQSRHVKWLAYKSEKYLGDMQEANRVIMNESLATGRLKANVGRPWGVGDLLVNFDKEVVFS